MARQFIANVQIATVVAVCAVVMSGCRSLGPGSVDRDRIDYSASVGDSWKRQTLLNIVKLRYMDPPIFVDIGQIVASYSLESGVEVSGQASPSAESRFIGAGGHATYTDKPTITYTPLTGKKFLRELMTPFTPQAVFQMIQSGWPADVVLYASAASINGLRNQDTTISGVVPPEPEFLRVLELMRNIQQSGGVSLRVEGEPDRLARPLALRVRRRLSRVRHRSRDSSPGMLSCRGAMP